MNHFVKVFRSEQSEHLKRQIMAVHFWRSSLLLLSLGLVLGQVAEDIADYEENSVVIADEIMNITSEKIQNHFCLHENAFLSLEDCMDSCRNNVKSTTNPLAKTAWKVLRLNPGEFTVSEDHILTFLSKNKKYAQDKYVLNQDGTASLCHSLSSDFMNCVPKWMMTENETVYNATTFELYVESYQKTYEIGEFFIDSETNAIVLCEPDVTYGLYNKQGITTFVGTLCSTICLLVTTILVTVSSRFGPVDRALRYHFLLLTVAFFVVTMEIVAVTKSSSICQISSYLKLFFLLSGFMFLHLSFLHGLLVTKNPEGNAPDFFVFQIIGFGVPLINTVVAYIMDVWEVPKFRPEFKTQCWFPLGSVSGVAFCYGFIAKTVIANIIILSCCTYFAKSSGKKKMHKTTRLSTHILLLVVACIYIVLKLVVWFMHRPTGFFYYLNVPTDFLGIFELLAVIFSCMNCPRRKTSATNGKLDMDSNSPNDTAAVHNTKL